MPDTQESPAPSARSRTDGPAPGSATPSAALMLELSITYDGRHYHFGRYRYERLSDAAAYARKARTRRLVGEEVSGLRAAPMLPVPDAAQRQLMDSLTISYRDGMFHLFGYRYDRLADAVEYARLQLHRPVRPPVSPLRAPAKPRTRFRWL